MLMIQRYFDSGRGQTQAAVGTLTPAAMAKGVGIEMANMIRVFDSFCGPYPYKRLAVTSVPISYTYGQGWPGLIYLWSASFLDPTQRHAIGIHDETQVTDFFRAHEASHQWGDIGRLEELSRSKDNSRERMFRRIRTLFPYVRASGTRPRSLALLL